MQTVKVVETRRGSPYAPKVVRPSWDTKGEQYWKNLALGQEPV